MCIFCNYLRVAKDVVGKTKGGIPHFRPLSKAEATLIPQYVNSR